MQKVLCSEKHVLLFRFTNQKNKTLRLNFILFFTIIVANFSYSQSNDKPEKWKNSGTALFLVNQSSFSNWTSGGQSSISGTLKIDYNFNYASPDYLFSSFKDYEKTTKNLIDRKLVIPAYEQCIKASHCFNLLDSRGLISAKERQAFILRIRTLVYNCCSLLNDE